LVLDELLEGGGGLNSQGTIVRKGTPCYYSCSYS
jgi:hypothetical protein